ncbi:hypothetical protein [Pedobacter sp. JCM 36344]|uniref:hypothetical protein n=1 Tax=Pedobacter sp. JCM 36344 TaxID=3374280 RepID=UPI0039798869
MKLTCDQLVEIKAYISGTPRYRETYYELYDHIVNAMEQSDKPFSLDLMKQIVEDDFGGFQGIVKQEEIYQKSVTSKYNRLLRSEMLNSFRNSTVLSHLAVLFFGYMLYNASLTSEINLKPMVVSIVIFSCIPCLYYLFKRFVLDRNKYKLSIKYDFLHRCLLVGCLTTNTFNSLFVFQHSFFGITNHQRVIVLIVIMFILNLYVRSFLKVYNKRIKILAV